MPKAVVDGQEVKRELVTAATRRSPRSRTSSAGWEPTFCPAQRVRPPGSRRIEFYQFVHEQLDEYGIDEMRIAGEEDRVLLDEMRELARGSTRAATCAPRGR